MRTIHPPPRAAAVLCLASATLAGCAYMAPYVERNVTPDPVLPGEVMPQSRQAISRIDKWMDAVDKAHSNASSTRRGLNLLTFGLVTGGTIGAAREVSAAAVRNMALGAGATVTGNNLFVPPEQVTLYNSATTALMCVRGKGAGLRAMVVSQKAQLANFSPDHYRVRTFAPAGCPLDAQTATAFNAARAAYYGARTAIDQAEQSDASVAAKIEDAGRNVVVTLNSQLDLLSPSTDAILASAKSIVGISGSLPQAAPARLPAPAGNTCTATIPFEQARAELAEMAAKYDAVRNAIAQQVSVVGTLDTACTLAPMSIAAVTLNNPDVEIAKDQTFVVDISGGIGSYFWTPVGAAPPKELQVRIIGKSLVLTGLSTLAPGEYRIAVRDSSAMPTPAQLKITAK